MVERLPRTDGHRRARARGRARARPARCCTWCFPAQLRRTFVLGDAETTVGRDPSLDGLLVDHGTISRRHACVAPSPGDGAHTVVDLGSRNGTWIDGVRATGEPRALISGSVLRIGDTLLVYEKEPAEAAATDAPTAVVAGRAPRPRRRRARAALAARARRARSGAGADRRRDRHRQGAHRARAPPPERPRRQARGGQLRRAAARSSSRASSSATSRARSPAPTGAARALSRRRSRHAVPRRDRRPAARAAAQAAARAAGGRGAAGRRHPAGARRRARGGRHPPRPRARRSIR